MIIINTSFNVEKHREWSSSLPSQGLVFKRLTSKSNRNLGELFSCGGRKPGEPGEKPSEQGEEQQLT